MLSNEQKEQLRTAISKVPDHNRLDTHNLVWQLVKREKIAEAVYKTVKETIEVDTVGMKARDSRGRYTELPRLEREIERLELVEPEQWGDPLVDFVIDGTEISIVKSSFTLEE